MRSSVVEARGRRHGGVVEDFLIGVSVVTFGTVGDKSNQISRKTQGTNFREDREVKEVR
jgi:hypothetical protein